jgi:hypothetical protein
MSTTPDTSPKFALGALVATAAVNEAENYKDVSAVIRRHVQGDWGTIDPIEQAQNDEAVTSGDRIISAYVLPSTGNAVWVITDADNGAGRQVTTVLYPSEY